MESRSHMAGESHLESRLARHVEAFIAVGSNIDPERHIEKALLALIPIMEVVGISTFYRNDPEGIPDQSQFVNGVWRVATTLTSRALKLDVLRQIEGALGRRRSHDKFASRVIDLDLILYGAEVVNEPDLVLPHPDIYRRSFVAMPLAELAPALEMPDTKMKIDDLSSAKCDARLEALTSFTAHLREVHEKWTNNA